MGEREGCTRKVLRVNLTDKNSSTQHIDREVFDKFLGGTGEAAKL